MATKYKPDGYHNLTPYFILNDPKGFINFITMAFGAKEKEIHKTPDGTIVHAEFTIGDSTLMIASATEEYKAVSQMLHVYVEDVDSVFKKAIEEGAESLRNPNDEFYGDRTGGLKDKFGNSWWLATHIEDVSKKELERRIKEQMKEKK